MNQLNTLPAAKICAKCHDDLRNTGDAEWIKVYRVAPDILFTHSNHTKISCAVCHSAMSSGVRWVHESRFKMDFCMECHAKAGARNDCGACHKNR